MPMQEDIELGAIKYTRNFHLILSMRIMMNEMEKM